jgi:hypothetical protein
MNSNYMVCMFLLLIIIIIIVISSTGSTSTNNAEGFADVLGQLGPYKEELNDCLNNVMKDDPTSSLKYPNLFGSMYCNSMLTEKARRGIPPNKYPNSNINICREQCEIPGMSYNKKRKCIIDCHNFREVADKCSVEVCPYTKMDPKVCMKDCISKWSVNSNWSWKPS